MPTINQQYTAADLSALAQQLNGAHQDKQGWRAKCPVHQGQSDTSLHLWLEDGQLRVHCFAECPYESLLQALGVDQPRRDPTYNAIYSYHDATGTLRFQVCRKPGKKFIQRRPHPRDPGQWIYDLKGVRRCLYRLPEVRQAVTAKETIYLVEGEKDVETLRALGLTATCNPGGAGKWEDQYSEQLDGATVVLLPDNDEPGRKHAQLVQTRLASHVTLLVRIDLPGLPEHGDVSDWLAAGHTREELQALVTQTTPQPRPCRILWQKATDLLKEVLAPTKWCIEGLLPEGAAILAGRPKKGKSLLGLNLAIAKATGGLALGKYPAGPPGDVAYLSLEDGKKRMQTRLEALLPHSGPPPDRLSFAYNAPCWEEGLLRELEDWITHQANPALIVIDILARIMPTRISRAEDPYRAEYRTIAALMDLATRYGVTILIIHHTAKAKYDDVMDSVLSTTGLTGATAVNMVLRRGRNDATGTLSITGKDLEDLDIALELKDLCWYALGRRQDVAHSEKQQQVLDLLTEYGPLTIRQLAEALEQPYPQTKLFLWRMGEARLIALVEGRYQLVKPSPPPEPPASPETGTDRMHETSETMKPDETGETMKPPVSDAEKAHAGFKVSSPATTDETYFRIENTLVTGKVSQVSAGSSGAMNPPARSPAVNGHAACAGQVDLCPDCGSAETLVRDSGGLVCFVCRWRPHPH